MKQKSKIQEMFPIDEKGLWRSTFLSWSMVSLLLVPLLIIWLFSEQAMEILAGNYNLHDAMYSLGILVLGLTALFTVLYFLSNYIVRRYNFDIIEGNIIERYFSYYGIFMYYSYPGFYVNIIPISLIKAVAIRQRNFGGSYCLSILPDKSILPAVGLFINPYYVGYFDEKTALALKEYILSQAKRARSLGDSPAKLQAKRGEAKSEDGGE